MSLVCINSIKPTLIIAKNVKHLYKQCKCISTCIINTQIKNDNGSVNVFDRNTKNLQRERAAVATDVNVYDYLKDEIGYRLADRVFDIKRKFKLAADIGRLPLLMETILLPYTLF